MQPRKAQKADNVMGYVLLALGLVLIIFPACPAMCKFLSRTTVPQLVPTPTTQSEFAVAFASFSNFCMTFFIFAIMMWAGSIVTSRGVAMIEDVRLKLVKKGLDEAARAIGKTET